MVIKAHITAEATIKGSPFFCRCTLAGRISVIRFTGFVLNCNSGHIPEFFDKI